MFKSTAEFDKAVYDALIRLRDGENLNEKPSNLSQEDYSDVLAYLDESRFTSSETRDRNHGWNGFTVYKISPTARISRVGLAFIEQSKP